MKRIGNMDEYFLEKKQKNLNRLGDGERIVLWGKVVSKYPAFQVERQRLEQMEGPSHRGI
jgi:hypothetical protein